jgi:UDP-N-acetylglucosamine--N-acetylmuramyl-(pentapeptide) pyrophosphoryl-undecaprenol N-acetylglucosamine transferase
MAAAVAHPWDFDGQRPLRLLIVGGSLGAKPLNDLVPGVVRKLLKSDEGPGLEVWHQSGAAHGDAVRSAYGRAADGPVKITEFIEDMAGAYGWADLVLCRAGALTVAELAIMGRPALLVPLPHAIDDHQTANARALTDRGAGIMLKQSELNASRLHDILQSYLSRPERLAIMAAAARDAAHPDATRDVADRCEEFLA